MGRVVIAGASRDPVYASGFFTRCSASAPGYEHGAWVWTVQPGGPSAAPALGAHLPQCRAAAAAPDPRDNRWPCRSACSSHGGPTRRREPGCDAGRRLGAVQPILHLSIPVRDMDEARDFYVHTLGCQAARTRADFTDMWFYGMQITLQDRPGRGGRRLGGGARGTSASPSGGTSSRP